MTPNPTDLSTAGIARLRAIAQAVDFTAEPSFPVPGVVTFGMVHYQYRNEPGFTVERCAQDAETLPDFARFAFLLGLVVFSFNEAKTLQLKALCPVFAAQIRQLYADGNNDTYWLLTGGRESEAAFESLSLSQTYADADTPDWVKFSALVRYQELASLDKFQPLARRSA